jgi:phosphate:Na+ symporter
METIGLIFCGLGLFFAGFRMIRQNLRQLTGSRFKQMIERATRTRFLSAFAGFLSGAVSQSAMASAFVTTGFHTAGILSFRRSMTIINWANIGTALLPFVLILNVKVLIYYLIGLIGLAFFLQLDRTIRLQVLLQFLMGLALLFLGILLIKSGAGPMAAMPWFRDALKESSGSIILLFLAGTLLTVAAQSGPTVAVVALSLASAGLLSIPNTLVVVLGTGSGAAINILILSSKLKGSGKQLCIYQGLFKITGVIAVALLLVIDYFLPDGERQVQWLSLLSNDPGRQVAFVFLIMQLLPTLLLTAVRDPVTRLLQRISPATAEDKLMEAEFINDLALGDPETALYLASREQMRLMRLLPDYVIPVSPDRMLTPAGDRTVLHEGFTRLDQQIIHYLDKLSARSVAPPMQEKVMETKQFSALLRELESTLNEFVVTIHSPQRSVADQPLAVRIIESLRTILDTSIESFENQDLPGLEILLSITADKGDLLHQIRQEFAQKNTGMDPNLQQSLYTITILFDRICWLLRKMTVISLKGIPT